MSYPSPLDEINVEIDASDLSIDATLVLAADGSRHPIRGLPMRGSAQASTGGQAWVGDGLSLSVCLPDVQVSPGSDTVEVDGATYNVRSAPPYAWRRVLLDLEGPL